MVGLVSLDPLCKLNTENLMMDPIVFEPYFRPQVWGGRRLEQYLGRPLPAAGAFGEAWVLSAQSLHVSRVAEGPLQGLPLTELWATRQNDLTGRPDTICGTGVSPARAAATAAPQHRPFPLLLKYLDCQDLLSIQVHPTDEIARELRPGELGKTEAWVVLDADPSARIYAGLRSGVTRADVQRGLADGSLAQCLHAITPQKGQCIFLRAGTVHAVGGGVLIAEVQQSSDATFRLFDWNRPGADGKPRTLHTEEALRSIDWTAGPVSPAVGLPIPGLAQGGDGQRLVECRYFSIDRYHVSAPRELPYPGQLSLWMVLQGGVELDGRATGYRRRFSRGETVLVPAAARELRWQPVPGQEAAILLGVLIPNP
jgi:mannose-6-phosphate isomerase